VSDVAPALRAVLHAAQQTGAIGPGAIEDAIAHSLGFVPPELGVDPDFHAVDLGSGGGLPGLPLALHHPASSWLLVDAWARRVEALERAIRTLGLEARVRAVHARAEDFARSEGRAHADLVVARGFGPPAQAAECAAPLLRVGGWFVASTSPDGSEWPARIERLSLVERARWRTGGGSFVGYELAQGVEDRYPRRPAAQRRSPLF
jgi:16S rRNA (guanine527-N7)-methyltransferase